MKDFPEQDFKVADLLRQHGVSYQAEYLGFDPERDSDKFYCTFKRGTQAESFEYFTGLGHRVNNGRMGFKVIRDSKAKAIMAMAVGEGQRYHHTCSKVIKNWFHSAKLCDLPTSQTVFTPTPASVLYCLLLDASVADESFPDWCDSMGMDYDSIKALNTYGQCCESRKKLNKLCSSDIREQLNEALQDY